jgi:outer membrane protein assembly factor BamB
LGLKGTEDWTGEVIGPPSLHCLKTVSVVAGGKTLVVLGGMNRKLWQATLTYDLAGGGASSDDEAGPFGLGPCVERGDMLYVFDQAVLTAFELRTGSVRWRLPSVGIVGMFFDDKGMMYLNTTTASPDSIKYSRQIDVTQTVAAIIIKIDPKTGKILWSVDPGGFVSYVSGKYIYLVQSYDADDQKENPWSVGLEPKSHVWIRRLNSENGRVMWEHYQGRAPLDVRFNENSIQILFKKELQVLRYLSL